MAFPLAHSAVRVVIAFHQPVSPLTTVGTAQGLLAVETRVSIFCPSRTTRKDDMVENLASGPSYIDVFPALKGVESCLV